MMFTHNIVEYAGDIVIKRSDPDIGQKIMEAAMVRTPSFWALLMRAFPRQYKPLIKAAEEAFQRDMIQYGLLLQADEETIIAVVSNQLAGFAISTSPSRQGTHRLPTRRLGRVWSISPIRRFEPRS